MSLRHLLYLLVCALAGVIGYGVILLKLVSYL